MSDEIKFKVQVGTVGAGQKRKVVHFPEELFDFLSLKIGDWLILTPSNETKEIVMKKKEMDKNEQSWKDWRIFWKI